MKQRTWKHIIIFLLAIPVINNFAGYLGNTSAQHANAREASSAPQPIAKSQYQVAPDIKIVVSRQSSEGITQDQMSQTFLSNLESYTVERIKTKIDEHHATRGQVSPAVNIRSEANFIEVEGKKLAIVRLFEKGASNSALIAGINGSELVRLLCTTKSTVQIELTTGACGEKISEIFGVSFR